MTPMDTDRLLESAAAQGDPEANYRLGIIQLQHQRAPVRARPLLEAAAAAGHADARNVLGTMYLNGLGIGADAARARLEFEAASESGSVAAPYNLANLLCNGIGGDPDRVAGRERLLAAGRRGHPPALRAIALLLGPDRDPVAESCLRAAAYRGDRLAAYFLGQRIMAGRAGGSKEEGVGWIAAAAEGGIDHARRVLRSLLAAGRRVPATPPLHDPSSAPDPGDLLAGLQFELPSQPELNQRQIEASPRIEVVDDLLDRELCDYLVIRAEPQLMASETIHPETGGRIQNALRTSRSMNFDGGALDVVMRVVLERIAAVAGLPLSHAEPLAVLHYAPGQEYRPHYDYFTQEAMQTQEQLAAGGQRVATVLTYLNDVAAGGETAFPEIGIDVSARCGRSFVFFNCDEQGQPDPNTLHAGRPVTAGEKWVATLWFRERVPDALADPPKAGRT